MSKHLYTPGQSPRQNSIPGGSGYYQATPPHSQYGEMIVMIPSAQSPSSSELNQLAKLEQSGRTQVQRQSQNHHNYQYQSYAETQGPTRPSLISRQDVRPSAQPAQSLYVLPPQSEQQPSHQMVQHNLVDYTNGRPRPKKARGNSFQHSPSQLTQQASIPQQSNHLVPKPIVQILAPSRPVTPSDSPMDYRILLLALAEQYIWEARSMSVSVSLGESALNRERYQDLMDAGLTCIETVIKRVRCILGALIGCVRADATKQQTGRVSPRQEALLQLRYATLLFEETEDQTIAESLLGKGISFCMTNHLHDILHGMQHLLVRIMIRQHPRPAMRYLQKVISEIGTRNHVIWMYAYHFLRISLALQINARWEHTAILQDLTIISTLAKRHGDTSVALMAAVVEAMVHLRTHDSESNIEVQRAIATARGLQQSIGKTVSLQIKVLILMLDVSCSLDPYDGAAAHNKISAMQELLEAVGKDKSFYTNGNILVPVGENFQLPATLARDSGGIFTKNASGAVCLTMSWLDTTDSFAIGFFLSAVASHSKNASDWRRTESFLRDGLKMSQDENTLGGPALRLTISQACATIHRKRLQRAYILLQSTILYEDTAQWEKAGTSLAAVRTLLPLLDVAPTSGVAVLSLYLSGVLHQGLGDSDAALQAYQVPELELQDYDARGPSNAETTIRILAAFNALLILKTNASSTAAISTLLARLNTYFPSSTPGTNDVRSAHVSNPYSSNAHLSAAHSLLLSALATRPISNTSNTTLSSILTTKSLLQRGLSSAKAAGNTQLIALCLALIARSFFAGIVGEQAVQAASAARSTAKVAGSRLWAAVATEASADVLRRSGRHDEAGAAAEAAQRLAVRLPAGVFNER